MLVSTTSTFTILEAKGLLPPNGAQYVMAQEQSVPPPPPPPTTFAPPPPPGGTSGEKFGPPPTQPGMMPPPGDQNYQNQPPYMGPPNMGPGGQPPMGGEKFGPPPQGQPGSEGYQGQPGMSGPPQGMQQGPSQEDMEKMQAEQEAKRAEMEKKQLAQMKKGMLRAASELKRMKTFFDKFTAKGIAVPADCSDALTKAQAAFDAIQAAETMEAAQDAGIEEVGDHFQTLQECRQKLEMLSRIPGMLKKIDREIARVERDWNRTKKNAPEAAAEAVTDGDAALASIKDTRVKVDVLVKEGNVEDMQELVEDGIFGKFDDIRAAMERIQAAKNAKRFIAEYQRRTRDAERTVARLKKLGEDTSKLEGIIAAIKQKYEEVKGLKTGSEEWLDAVMELAEIGQDFAEAAGGTEDVGASLQKGPGSFGPIPQVRLPQGFNP